MLLVAAGKADHGRNLPGVRQATERMAAMSSDLDGTWERWRAGLCPCCGMAVIEHCDGTKPQVIGEGVGICGRCVANGHLRDGFGELILAALVMKR